MPFFSRRPFPTNEIHFGVNCAGLCVGLLVWFVLLPAIHLQPQWAFLLTLIAVVAPVVLFERLWLGWHRWQADTRWKAMPWRERFDRLGCKWLGLIVTTGVILVGYGIFPVYRDTFYQPFFYYVAAFYLWFVLLSIPYLLAADAVAPENDAYYVIGRFLIGKRTDGAWKMLGRHARDWMVKAYFLPLMIVFLQQKINYFANTGWPGFGSAQGFVNYLFELTYLVDVWFASIGYLMTSRLLNSHIRSSEPTAGGWIVALACYPPFLGIIFNEYLRYDADGVQWQDWFANNPFILWVWGGAILVLSAIYALATVALGYRFSNLTYRGLTRQGPYRFSKHPAYISKNLSWWLISVPFLAMGWKQAVAACLLMLGVNVIYYLRARSEENHLSRYPEYVEYALEINRRSPLRHIPWLRYKPPASI